MVAIVQELFIEAGPRHVWDALTLPDEIAGWWTDDVSVRPEVGTLAEFRFSQGTFHIQFEIAELDKGSKVVWITRQGPSTGHWAGTSVTWQLEPTQNGRKLVLTLAGFAQVDEVFEETRSNWRYYLDSLKSYLETGTGTPGLPRPSR
jgi:uncharacterized protein YndB with AHSA1/START domain